MPDTRLMSYRVNLTRCLMSELSSLSFQVLIFLNPGTTPSPCAPGTCFPTPISSSGLVCSLADSPNPIHLVEDLSGFLRRTNNQSLCFGVLKLQEEGIPVITTIHHPITSDLEIALSSAGSWKLRWLIRRWHSFLRMQKQVVPRLKHIVTVSKTSRADIASAFSIDPQKIDIVHNGIDTSVFKPLPDITRKPYRIMVTASADAPLKGLDYLLKAMALLIPEQPALELLVLGKLKEDGETRKLIEKLKIGKHLKFVSGIETEELVRLYAQATLVVVPSIYEGFGLPAGEAMACGVPVISTDGGALPEVVGNCGLIVPTRDETAIARAIDDLLGDPAKREQLGRKARARIVSLFSWQVAAKDMVDLYSRVLGREVDRQEEQDVPANG